MPATDYHGGLYGRLYALFQDSAPENEGKGPRKFDKEFFQEKT